MEYGHSQSKSEPENTRSSSFPTLREKIGLGTQVAGLAGLLGSAALSFYQGLTTSHNPKELPFYLIMASLATVFLGSFVKGFQKPKDQE
jgi:hypothetical protein